MPAYRAERTLAQTVADIPPAVADRLILVDDASPDNTAQLARKLGIDVYVHAENRGYGGNQKTCYIEALRSGADIVILLHPDYQYEPKAVPLLIAPILAGDADMTFGSRFAGLGDPIGGGMPVYRYVGNRATTVLENLMLGSRFTELHSGLRAYTRHCLLSLPFLRYSNSFVFDSQLLIDAVTSGQRVVEVPIPTRYTKESSSIAIGSSLAYIGGSLGYCAGRVAIRGRRGRRSPVARPDRLLDLAPPEEGGQGRDECPACGRRTHRAATFRCPQCGLVSHASEGQTDHPFVSTDAAARAIGQRLLDAIGGYFVGGELLRVLGPRAPLVADLAAERGWRAAPPEGHLGAAAPADRVDRRSGWITAEAQERQGPVDIVMLLDVLGSAADPVRHLERFRPMLDPEGILAVPTVMARSRVPGHRIPASSRGVRFSFTSSSLSAVLDRAGFRIVEWLLPPRLHWLDIRSRVWSPAARQPSATERLAGLGIAVARPRRAADTLARSR
jgi:hypothetical protein